MILVDSDVLIAHLRGLGEATAWLTRRRSAGDQLAASVVSITEITGGMRSPERREVRSLLQSLQIEGIDEQVATRAGELMRQYRRSHSRIGLGDCLIAATAEVRTLELATLNVRHFPMFPGLQAPFPVRRADPSS